MRKILFPAAVLSLAFILLTSCSAGDRDTGDSETEENLNKQDTSSYTSENERREKPPELILETARENSTENTNATMGTYSWTYQDENGEQVGVEADSAHPLDIIDQLAVINIDNTDGKIKIKAEDAESWQINCWSKGADIDDCAVIAADDGIITPETDGEYIYEVIVQYTDGTVYYAFCTTAE